MAIQLTFTQSKEVISRPATQVTTKTLTVVQEIDDGASVKVLIKELGLTNPVTIWSATTSPTYSQIGQWSDSDVLTQLKVIYGS